MFLIHKLLHWLFGKTMRAAIRNVFLLFVICQFISLIFATVNVVFVVNQEIFHYQREVIRRISSELDNLFDKVSLIERQLIWQVSTSHDRLRRPGNTARLEQRELETQLRNMRRANDDIHDMYVVFDNGQVMSSAALSYDRELLRTQVWMDEELLSARDHMVVPTHDVPYVGYPGKDVRVVSLVRKVLSLYDLQETAAIIQIDINYSSLEDILNDVSITAGQDIYILDENNRVICHPDNTFIGLPVSSLPGHAVGSEVPSGMYPDSNLIVINQPLSVADWHVMVMMDYDSIFEDILASAGTFLTIPLLTIVVFLVLSRTFSRHISAPLTAMMQHMQHMGDGHMEPVELKATSSEIVVLSDTFNDMLGRIKQLIAINKRKEHEAARIRYQMQMAQINPHFLYNTLETMRALALQDGSGRVAEIAKAIAAIFHYSTALEEEVPLREELEVIRQYMLIQNHRFGDRFDWFSHVPPELLDVPIILFSLQPVVENTIIHGTTGGGHTILYIKAYCSGGKLTVEITDNGTGIMPERLDAIRHQLYEKTDDSQKNYSSTSIGLPNVHARIRYKYGHPYGLEIDGHANAGTTVLMHFPLLSSGQPNTDSERRK